MNVVIALQNSDYVIQYSTQRVMARQSIPRYRVLDRREPVGQLDDTCCERNLDHVVIAAPVGATSNHVRRSGSDSKGRLLVFRDDETARAWTH